MTASQALIQSLWTEVASDLHLRSGQAPMVRVDGRLRPIEGAAPTPAEFIEAWREEVLSPDERDRYARCGAADAAWQAPGQRWRLNFFKSAAGGACVARRIASQVPDCASLGVPEVVLSALQHRDGLITVTGPTGSGKSTTLAAMVQALHQSRPVHTITLEDPIEYQHEVKQGLVTQRQVGRDTPSFSQGLRDALREDPDVILVGELRDAQTIGLALTAAETGHLVLATLHTRTASGSVTRIIDSLPPEQQAQARAQLAEVLRLSLSQALWPRADGHGRVAAFEVLVATPAIQHLIREQKIHQIDNVMQTQSQLGMQTMAKALTQLQQRGAITPSVSAATNQ